MSDRNTLDRIYCPRAVALALNLGLLATLGDSIWVRADEPKAQTQERRTVVGRAARLSALLRREGPEKTWRLIKPTDPIYSDEMVVAIPHGAINSVTENIRLRLLSDLARLSPYPVLESAVVVHENPELDLDFTLDRGRVDVTIPPKKKAPAHVRVRFRNQKWDLTFAEPGTAVGLELYGRWPKGVPFKKPKPDSDKNPEDEPTADLVLIVIHGEVDLKTGSGEYAMRAPPGPAFFHWDSAGGADTELRRLDELPVWATPAALIPRVKDVGAALESIPRLLGDLKDKSIEEALADTLNSPNPSARKIAVYGLGAVDDLPHLADALADPSHQDVRDVAVLALRAWIGRDRGQDMKLYNLLVKEKKYSENQAEIVLQLLHSFGQNDLAKPATYETLIDYLLHDKPAIRQLAKWHLERLVPEVSKEVAYDPAASEKERQEAHEKWKERIPSGKLPPERKSSKPKAERQ